MTSCTKGCQLPQMKNTGVTKTPGSKQHMNTYVLGKQRDVGCEQPPQKRSRRSEQDSFKFIKDVSSVEQLAWSWTSVIQTDDDLLVSVVQLTVEDKKLSKRCNYAQVCGEK